MLDSFCSECAIPVLSFWLAYCRIVCVREIHTCTAGRELYITPLHPVELLALRTFGALLDHAVAVGQLAAEDVAEDLGIAVRVGREPIAGRDAVLVEYAQTAELVELVVVVVGEAEGVEGLQPAAVFGVAALAGAAGHDGGVSERLGHFDGSIVRDNCFGDEEDERSEDDQ